MVKETDIDIVRHVRGTVSERNNAVRSLMNDRELHRKIVRLVCNNSGTRDEAEMIFDDMILCFVKKAMENENTIFAVARDVTAESRVILGESLQGTRATSPVEPRAK